MATQFIKVRDFAEAVGFDVEKWQISENSTANGCVCKMRMTAKDDADPKCLTCLGEKTVQGPPYGSGQSDTLPCPDCATQPFDPAAPKATKSIP